MPYDEPEIIQQAQAGERAAFAALYDQHYLAIYTFIYYRVDDQATAEDLTAQVFVRMVEKIDRYRNRGKPFVAWLYTVARNLLTDHYRQAKRATPAPLEGNLSIKTENPSTTTERQLMADCLRQALRHLTEAQQTVIVGKFVESRSNADMAAIMGKHEGSIKSLQHRALAALRRAIEKEGCYEP